MDSAFFMSIEQVFAATGLNKGEPTFRGDRREFKCVKVLKGDDNPWRAVAVVTWLCAHHDRPSITTWDNDKTLYITSGRQKCTVRIVFKSDSSLKPLANVLKTVVSMTADVFPQNKRGQA